MSNVVTDFVDVFTRWQTWWLMASNDIKLRYRRSLIGPFWISLTMATMILGIALLFGQIYEQEFRDFLFFLGCSFLIWFFISSLMNDACTVLIENEGILRSAPIKTPLLAARSVARNVIIFGHNALAVTGMLLIMRWEPTIAALWAIPAVLLVTAFGYFFAVAIAPLCLRFRDVAQVVTNLLQILFFMTPVMWPPTQGRVSESFIKMNPFYHLVELFRAPIYTGVAPTELNWNVSLGMLGGVLILAVVSAATSRSKIYLWL